MILRDYQVDAKAAIRREHERVARTAAVMATGLGKTEIIVSYGDEVASYNGDRRVLVVVPLVQLIQQTCKKFRDRTGVQPSVEQANSRSSESGWARSPFVVGSKQTLCGRSKRYQRFKDIALVVLDEGHMMLTKPVGEMIDYFLGMGAKLLVVTATGKLSNGRGIGALADSCAYQMAIGDAIPQGWLVPPRATCCQLESLDLSTVGTKGANGDFKDGELAKVMEDEKVVCEVAEITAAESVGLKTVVYCASVDEARQVANRLVDTHRLKADWVCSDQRLCDEQRRRHVVTSFTDDPDGVQIVCNVGVLTTGWDFPGLEHIVMARPTKSLALFTQIMGRGTRPLPGVVDFTESTPELRRAAIAASRKPFYKVTDLRDNTLDHKLVSVVDVLAGSRELAVVRRAKQKLSDSKEAQDVAAAIDDAQAEWARDERQRIARLEAKAQYNRVPTDPFDDSRQGNARRRHGRSPRMPFGKHKGKPLDAVPTSYLEFCVAKGWMRTGWLRDAVQESLKNRVRREGPPIDNGALAIINQFVGA